MKRYLLVAIVSIFTVASHAACADCVISAKTSQRYQILDAHTVLLSGGIGGQIMVKSFAFFNSSSQVAVLKDNFCDFESSVLYVDGEPIDAQQVKQLR